MPIENRSILALARSGAIGQAWSAFNDAGLSDIADDPAVLTLRGRLLKDRARAADDPAGRARLFGEAAAAYAAAARLAPASYPLINAATMALFAGDEPRARTLAGEVEAMLASGRDHGETPYWHDATRAEALLLLGRHDDAQSALEAAIRHAPQAWEDLATTLRQFRLIEEFRNADTGWLARYAPPASLHFSGLIGISDSDRIAAGRIEDAVERLQPGFAYGAIAAGADILIAEACLARGAELHAILPVDVETFRACSVAPYGEGWARRFDALLEQVASVHVVAPHEPLSGAAIELAAHVAAGCAIRNARQMESTAKALQVVVPGHDAGSADTDIVFVHVERSLHVDTAIELSDAAIRYWLATAERSATVPAVDTLADMRDAIAKAVAASHCSVALDVGITAIEGHDEDRQARAARIAQAGTSGTILATHDAAMRWLSVQPESQMEPVGEMPSNDGAVTLYAIRS